MHAIRHSDAGKPKARVLVVDDDLDTVHSMAMLIKMMGHEVQFAINGFAGLDIARTFRPDVILLDINLPDFKGDHFARQLKYEPGLERTCIVAVTGQSDEQARQRALDAGCAAFYVKPLTVERLEFLLNGGANRSAVASG
jgi:CheY-like chemotaxis protein